MPRGSSAGSGLRTRSSRTRRLELGVARGAGRVGEAAVGVGHLDRAQVGDPLGQQARQRVEALRVAARLVQRGDDVGHQGAALALEPPPVHVEAEADHPREATALVHRGAAVDDPAVDAVVAEQPVLHLEGHAVGERVAVHGEAALQVVGVDPLRPAVAELLVHPPAAELEPGPVEVGQPPGRLAHPDQRGRGVGHRTEQLVRPAPHSGCLDGADQILQAVARAGGLYRRRRPAISAAPCLRSRGAGYGSFRVGALVRHPTRARVA